MKSLVYIYSTGHEYPDTHRVKNTVENGLCRTVHTVWHRVCVLENSKKRTVSHRDRPCNSVATVLLCEYRYLTVLFKIPLACNWCCATLP